MMSIVAAIAPAILMLLKLTEPPAVSVLLSTDMFTLIDEDAILPIDNFVKTADDKADPAKYAGTLKTRPWSVVVDGQCGKPGTYNIEDIMKFAPLEERIYRLRCVEAWSMVVPWLGFPLAALLKEVEPQIERLLNRAA